MKTSQIAGILNDVFAEIVGGDTGEGTPALIAEDLSNIVDIGRQITASTQWGDNFDSYVKKIIDKVGRVIFWDRVYRGDDLGLRRESWEYGSVLEKIRVEVGDFTDDNAWQLTDNPVPDFSNLYDFNAPPEVSAKYFNFQTAFELEICIARVQAESAFRSASDMQRFFGMIENRINTKMEIATEGLAYRAENNFIAEHVKAGKVVNLLTMYKQASGDTTITAAKAFLDIDFLRWCVQRIRIDKALLRRASTRRNLEGYVAFTPSDRLRVYALTDFAAAMESVLMSQTYHDEFVTLGGYHEIAYWQGEGINSTWTERSTINAIPASEGPAPTSGQDTRREIDQSGIVFVMQDYDAVMICREITPVESLWNPKGRFYKYFYKHTASYYNDLAENAIVYIISDAS